MRISEVIGKELVNIYDGSRLGVIGDADLVVDPDTGRIHSIVLPRKPTLLTMWLERQQLVVPWEAVRKIGNDVIVVDLDQTTHRLSRFAL